MKLVRWRGVSCPGAWGGAWFMGGGNLADLYDARERVQCEGCGIDRQWCSGVVDSEERRERV